ncbi:HHL053Wp [Eremothecium sinecaudum]|uniref:HHL053Wp n=1 Tax=Eremothecium sinecaudum TaxID=45286 RepID=A0A0X8HWB7_9SACH|nr:HHL053Wp [Eremothecium sinecaudum]AMD22717.1 HHL053Wp [Eremothecium sinecaudum]
MGKNKKKVTKANKLPKSGDESSVAKIVDEVAHKDTSTTAPVSGDGELNAETVENSNNCDDSSEVGTKDDKTVDDLRDEIAQLRLQLENNKESGTNDEKLLKIQEERDYFESQYNTLLSRLSSMKSLFSKMKESQLELESTQEQLAEYESRNLSLKNKLESLAKENEDYKQTVSVLNSECESLSSECSKYKARADAAQTQLETTSSKHNKSVQEKTKENQMLQSKIQEMAIVIDSYKQDLSSMKEEILDYKQQLAQLQREKEQTLKSCAQLEEQLAAATTAHEHDVRTLENELKVLKEAIEKSSEEAKIHESTIADLQQKVDLMKEGVALKDQLQQECKERGLQIGKLRHEAIILNEHLTKALALIKHSNNSESVDKELISNLLISFVSIPRADPKKFEVLELISSFLNWDDDKKMQAGLINVSASDSVRGRIERKDSFVSLWADYLEKESQK